MEAHSRRGFIALAILVLTASLALCEEGSTDLVALPSTEESVPREKCSKDGHICNNCTSAPFCVSLPNGDFLNAGDYNCEDQDSAKPYCSAGVCGAEPSSGCEPELQKPTLFHCTVDGYVPDPDDCHKFHFCVKNQATTYPCSANYVYSHEKKSCVRQRTSADCAVIKCKYAVPYEYVVYPKDPSVYGLCVRNKTTLVFRCRDGEQFDIKTKECSFVCKKEGLFPVEGDDKKYHECVLISSNKFEVFERECPPGSKFDSDKQRCEIE
ncbi:uncharacterized protein LOC110827807 isoform X2 [Zootermopsis nevadensis]|uniref:uncharacterized protein LOC110827807 isoform X2 n=1 Tax=Zootermopsis nevadensis TaxID=136037 RepID=UPI000B8EB854|nr:uncharacterized protein LOC110827807 isoform X2 [Zootermopsis nevadensis]